MKKAMKKSILCHVHVVIMQCKHVLHFDTRNDRYPKFMDFPFIVPMLARDIALIESDGIPSLTLTMMWG